MSSVTRAIIETSNFVGTLIIASPSPERGVVRCREPFKFVGAPIISPELLKLELSNFVHREAI